MKDTKAVLNSFLEKAVQEKTITDTEIIEQLADIPDVDFDEVYNKLTEAGAFGDMPQTSQMDLFSML